MASDSDHQAGELTSGRTDALLRINAFDLNPIRLKGLLAAFDNDPVALAAAGPADWRSASPELTDKQVERMVRMRDRPVDSDLALLEKLDAEVIELGATNYPANLRQISDAPPILISRGRLVPEDKFSVAIVGSRRASSYGLSLARRFAKALADHGLTVVSGGARGIDTQAHLGALEGGGRTIAFVGSGIDVHYPADNKKLFERIAGCGAVVSEFPLGTRPEPWRFPARNRLISGTSLGVLVIESPIDSGALISAREAADQGREVFAIPGPIDTGRNAGCHRLIQEGAKLVETVDDILCEIGVLNLKRPDDIGRTGSPPPSPANLPPEQRKILDMLTLQARNVDSLIVESGLTAPQVIGILTLLEMRGLCRRVPGNAFVRVL
ncbi:MAG: DNA-processing protein DprA [Capsulimonadaceae bacterium]